MTGSFESEMYVKIFRNLRENTQRKISLNSVVRISLSGDAFSGIPEPGTTSVEGQQLQQKDRKGRKKEMHKKFIFFYL